MQDEQSSFEKAYTTLLPVLAGANLIYGLGMLNGGLTVSFEQLVMDCEFAEMISFGLRGITVNDLTLAVDIIKEVGPGKDFMGHKDTFVHRKMQSQPQLMDRRNRGAWEASGSLDMPMAANLKAKKILSTHVPRVISPEILAKVEAIINEAEDSYGVARTKISQFYDPNPRSF